MPTSCTAKSWPPCDVVRRVTRVLIILVAFAVGPFGRAADIVWRNVGPGGGGWIQSLKCDPHDGNTIYLGCDVGGFYISRDGGRTWRIQNDGLNDYFIECIAVHPTDRRIIILGAEGGIFKSIDGGKTWQWKREGFPKPGRYSFSMPIGSVAFHPRNGNVVYAGVGRPRWQRDGKGLIYKSVDCGESWQPCVKDGELPKDAIVSDIEIAPDGEYILAIGNRGVFRSEGAADSWQPANAGLPHRHCEEATIPKSAPRVCYVTLRTTARDNQPWNGGVYRSDDGGRSWNQRSKGLGHCVGKKTQPLPMTSNYKEIEADPGAADVVYVGDRAWVTAGVYKTTDGGLNWARVSRRHGKTGTNMDYGWIRVWGPSVQCLTISPLNSGKLYFGTSGHVFATEDGGGSWRQRYCRELPDGRFAGNGLEVTCTARTIFDPFDPKRIYFCYYDIGLLITDDMATTFARSTKGMKHHGNTFTVVVDPADRNKLWACTGQWGSNRGDVCRSVDGGMTWTVVGKPESGLPDGQTRTLLLDPRSPPGKRTLYVICKGHGVYKSMNDGLTWKPVNRGLPGGDNRAIAGLALNPTDPTNLRALLGGNPKRGSGIYETKDGGGTWGRVTGSDEPFADVKHLAVDPKDWRTVYVCQREKYDRSYNPPRMFPGGLFRSKDGGCTWQCLHNFHFTNCLAVSPVDSRVLYLGTTDHPYHDGNKPLGLLKSIDGGETWKSQNTGLTCTQIANVDISPHDPSVLIVGTGGNGVFLGRDTAIAARLGKGE